MSIVDHYGDFEMPEEKEEVKIDVNEALRNESEEKIKWRPFEKKLAEIDHILAVSFAPPYNGIKNIIDNWDFKKTLDDIEKEIEDKKQGK